MEAVLSEHREHEKNLQNTLMTAQKLSDDIKANAELEARRIIREAEGRSDLLLEKTQARLEDIQREIDGLKLKRRTSRRSIEANIADAAQHARVRPRTGSARARGQDPAAPAARRSTPSRLDTADAQPDPQSRRVITASPVARHPAGPP